MNKFLEIFNNFNEFLNGPVDEERRDFLNKSSTGVAMLSVMGGARSIDRLIGNRQSLDGVVNNLGMGALNRVAVLTDSRDNPLQEYYLEALSKMGETDISQINTLAVFGSGVRDSSMDDALHEFHSDEESAQQSAFRTLAIAKKSDGTILLLGSRSEGYFTGSNPGSEEETVATELTRLGDVWGVDTNSGFVAMFGIDDNGDPSYARGMITQLTSAGGIPSEMNIASATPVPGVNAAELSPEPPTEDLVYTAEQIKEMTNTEILNSAEDVDGLEKFISPAGKHIVLYRNSEGKYVQAKNMLTKEMITDLIHVSMDPENPTKLTMDQIKSGAWADSERLQCPGFSKEVIPGDWFYAKGGSVWSVVKMMPDLRYSDPSTRPQKMCSYSEVVTDLGRGEQPYIVMGLAIKNKDNSVGFVHRWGRPEDLQGYLDIKDFQFVIVTDEIRHTSGYPEGEFLDETRPEVEEWALEFESADILPEDFERELFQLGAAKW
jgi:hypothetical protein